MTWYNNSMILPRGQSGTLNRSTTEKSPYIIVAQRCRADRTLAISVLPWFLTSWSAGWNTPVIKSLSYETLLTSMTKFCPDRMILSTQILLPPKTILPRSHGGHWPIALRMRLQQHMRHLVCDVPPMNHEQPAIYRK